MAHLVRRGSVYHWRRRFGVPALGCPAGIVTVSLFTMEKSVARRRLCCENLETNVHDPELRRRLTPDYAPGCKRLVISSRFYPAIQKPNAVLVAQPIPAIGPAGVRTRDGTLHALDVLVFATGFDPFAFFTPAEIVGPEGRRLNDEWRGSCRAHRTAMAPGFPNLFFIGGPNSPIGNFSFLRTAEVQIDYVVQLVGVLAAGATRRLEPTEEATEAFNARLVEGMKRTILVTLVAGFVSDC